MRLQIVLFLVLEATLAAALQYDSGSAEFDVLEEPREAPIEAPVRKDVAINVHPDDIEVIKGVIQKLLGREKLEHIKYHARTPPTRLAGPDASRSPTRSTEPSSLTEPHRVVSDMPATDTGKPETLEMQATLTDATQKLDWFEREETEYTTISSEGLPPLVSADGTTVSISTTSAMSPVSALSAVSAVSAAKMGEDNVETLGWDYANISVPTAVVRASDVPAPNSSDQHMVMRDGDERTRYTRRTTKSTRNTLCTESDEVCKTMCFDREKYRVSCPTTTGKPTTPYLDFTRLLNMISSLVVDYDTNLTVVMNHTLLLKGYHNCPPTTTTLRTTTTAPPQTPPMYDYEPSDKTGSVISKCYVCGMEELGIPRIAHCSDPFAKELLPPAMPDHAAETKRKGFRKYCNYMDMKPWYINGSGIWGKWTGGCAVRWVDLNGVYTQRVCRIRDRPAIGHHLVSKRLAKLEYALRKVDNGCILSPVATLVPFSRGVSLYARLHVCVCSGNWCNPATWPSMLQGLWAVVLLAAVLR